MIRLSTYLLIQLPLPLVELESVENNKINITLFNMKNLVIQNN
jgi:hypothetical protein